METTIRPGRAEWKRGKKSHAATEVLKLDRSCWLIGLEDLLSILPVISVRFGRVRPRNGLATANNPSYDYVYCRLGRMQRRAATRWRCVTPSRLSMQPIAICWLDLSLLFFKSCFPFFLSLFFCLSFSSSHCNPSPISLSPNTSFQNELIAHCTSRWKKNAEKQNKKRIGFDPFGRMLTVGCLRLSRLCVLPPKVPHRFNWM